jgi:hypothetical protein
MIKSPRSAAAEESRERVILVDDVLEQQMLDLKALRKEVAAAESAAAMKSKHELPQVPKRS